MKDICGYRIGDMWQYRWQGLETDQGGTVKGKTENSRETLKLIGRDIKVQKYCLKL